MVYTEPVIYFIFNETTTRLIIFRATFSLIECVDFIFEWIKLIIEWNNLIAECVNGMNEQCTTLHTFSYAKGYSSPVISIVMTLKTVY